MTAWAWCVRCGQCAQHHTSADCVAVGYHFSLLPQTARTDIEGVACRGCEQ